MKPDDFQKMLKGVNAGENLPFEFVQGVYDNVDAHPFTLNEDEEARMKSDAANAKTLKQKQEWFQKETEGLVKRGTNEMQGGQASKYVDVEGIKPIQPMFENSWSANLATFSVILEETQEQKIADLCVEAFIYSVKICGYFNMKVERDAFVSSLFKFTCLGTTRPMQKKHLNSIQAML